MFICTRRRYWLRLNGMQQQLLTLFWREQGRPLRTTAMVISSFTCCWLPFFVTTLLSAFCQTCIHDPKRVGTVVNWLGWINSAMNPIIYACWSRDFRRLVYNFDLKAKEID